MSLLNNPIPPKPSYFGPDGAPPGVATNFTAFKASDGSNWYLSRPVIKPRLQLIHTNGASREGKLQSQINWANANPGGNTHPHYSVNAPQPTKFVPTNRKGIGNYNVSDWSIVIETADAGWPNPGNAGGFLYDHAEIVARIIAYESIVWDIPLEYPSTWSGAGTACHTEPFGYPYWTNVAGKPCPGTTKKQQVRDLILPRARQIKTAWTGDYYNMAYHPMTPVRLFDSRNSGKLSANETKQIVAAGLPSGTNALAVNITCVENEGPGFLTLWDAGNRPNVSQVNYVDTNDTRNGFTIVPLTGYGTFQLFTKAKAHVIIDVVGAFVP